MDEEVDIVAMRFKSSILNISLSFRSKHILSPYWYSSINFLLGLCWHMPEGYLLFELTELVRLQRHNSMRRDGFPLLMSYRDVPRTWFLVID